MFLLYTYVVCMYVCVCLQSSPANFGNNGGIYRVNFSTSGPNLSFFTSAWAVGRVSTASDSASCSKFDAAANRFLLVLRFFHVMVSSVVSGPMRAGGSVRRTHGGLFSVRVTSLLRMVSSGTSNAERRTSSVIADLLRRMASMESASCLMRFFAYRYMNIQ